MNEAVKGMLGRYELRTTTDHENALKEIIQEIALLGLWRAKFFERAAFYGGSALRILHGLDRFSEDLDFSLLAPDGRFPLERYLKAVESELTAFGFSVTVEKKAKTAKSAIESAFIKGNTAHNLLVVEAAPVAGATHPGKQLKIKVEVDTDPPGAFTTEAKYLFTPIPFSVVVYAPPSLFAGKMHAILCRNWGTRVKGRDWYDLLWYVGRKTPLDLGHLEARMRQTGHYDGKGTLTEKRFRELLVERIASLDIGQARRDVMPLLRDGRSADAWSKDLFTAAAGAIVCG
ncbi:MAG TPA: nucleotidyl transferase AbiEii/AbiGii toxin family protein [bacterium]|nr:nucleotidyl transferase AbiEii/AbiGii toxin family protein [bacterium]